MTPVYILLAIIAIGVLLMTREGKGLLTIFLYALVATGAAIIAFYLAVGGFAFFQSDSFQWFYENVLPWVMLGLVASYGAYWLAKNFQDVISDIRKGWIEKRGTFIFAMFLILVILVSWIGVPLWIGA